MISSLEVGFEGEVVGDEAMGVGSGGKYKQTRREGRLRGSDLRYVQYVQYEDLWTLDLGLGTTLVGY